MEPAAIPLPPQQSSSRPLSFSSSSCPLVEWQSLSEPFYSSSASSSQPRICVPTSAKEPPAIYPPILPPPDFFDLETEAERLKDMFKKDNTLKNPLYDETGKVNLPVDDKGILILDPESRTKMVDVEVELDILYEYMLWITSATAAVEGLDEERRKEWFEGLSEAVNGELREVFDEWHGVVDMERGKRGLSDRKTHWDWYRKHTTANFEQEEINTEHMGDNYSSQNEDESSSLESAFNDKSSEADSFSEQPGAAANATSVTASELNLPGPPIDLVTLWW